MLLNLVYWLINGEYEEGTDAWKIERLNNMKNVHRDNLKVVNELGNELLDEVYNVMVETTDKSLDIEAFRKAFKLRRTRSDPDVVEYDDIVQKNTNSVEEEVREVLSQAVTNANKDYGSIVEFIALSVATGTMTYEQALNNRITHIANKGVIGRTYQGINKNGEPYELNERVEVVTRRSIMTKVNDSANETNELFIDILNPPQIAVSQHLGARDKGIGHMNHQSWQGKVFDNDGTFERVTGYNNPDMLGLGGYNCRHIHFPYFEGISSPLPETVDEEANNREYELNQKQRAYERAIRQAKVRLKLAEEVGDFDYISKSKSLVHKRQKTIREFVAENGLRRRYDREKI